MALIRYIGTKRHGRPDTVADTGIHWLAPGDVQEVPDEAVPKLLAYRDIWALVEEQTTKSEPKWPLDVDGERLVLDDKDDDYLKGFAKANGLKVDGRLKGDRLRAAVHAAAVELQQSARAASNETTSED